MTRNMLRFGMGALAVLPGAAIALGLGPIEVKSSLDQPLSARIPVLAAEPEQLEKLAAGLASREHFETVGVERAPVLSQLSFELVRPEGARPYIVVKSNAPIREPLLDMLVEVNWPGGTLLREYSLFLDPPGRTVRYAQSSPSVTTPSAPAASAPTAAPTRRVGTFSGSTYGPVAPGETLWSIAEQVRPDRGVSIQQMMLALLEANPKAFWSNNVNSLNKGAVLRVPRREEALLRSKGEAVAEASRQWKEWQANPSPYTQVAQADEQGPVSPVSAAEPVETEIVPLHQVLLVPSAEDEPDFEATSDLDATPDLMAQPTVASADAEGAAQGVGDATGAQPLVRVENGGLGLRLAGLDQLSERLPAIVGVDDSVLATGAVSEVNQGRLGQTIVEESGVAATGAEDVSEANLEEVGAESTAPPLGESVGVAGSELLPLQDGSDVGAQPSAGIEEPSATSPETQTPLIAESAAQSTADAGSGAGEELVPAPDAVDSGQEAGALVESPTLAEAESVAMPTGSEDLSASDTDLPLTEAEATDTEISTPTTGELPAVAESGAQQSTEAADAQLRELSVTDSGNPPIEEGALLEPMPESEAVATADLAAEQDTQTQAQIDATAEQDIQPLAQVDPPTADQNTQPQAEVEPTSALPPELLGLVSLLEEPRNLAMAGGVAILFLLLLMLAVRRAASRRRADDEPIKKPLARGANATVPDTGEARQQGDRVDPLKQVDVLVAVGNFAEASRIVAGALAENPDDAPLAFKQLEVDYAAHDVNAFSAHAVESRTRLEMTGLWPNVVAMGVVLCPDHPLFALNGKAEPARDEPPPPPPSEVEAEVDDSIDSRGEAVSEHDADGMTLDGPGERTEPTLGSMDAPTEADADDLEFDLPDVPSAVAEDNDERAAAAESIEAFDVTDEDKFFSPVVDDTASNDVDLGFALEAEFEKLEMEGLGDIGDSVPEPHSGPSDRSSAEDSGLDFGDFTREDSQEKQAIGGSAPSSTDDQADSSIPSFDSEAGPDRETLNDSSEGSRQGSGSVANAGPIEFDGGDGDSTFVETKLDLAAAYLELGDDAGAKTLYQEVLSEGNVDQKRLADEALRKLA